MEDVNFIIGEVFNMNKVCLLGRMCADVELKYTQSQKAITRFTIAVDRRGKDAGTDFITCMAWDKTAEFMQKYCTKGMQVVITGRIQTGSYTDKDGKTVYTTDVVVEEIKPIWNKKEDNAPFGDTQASTPPNGFGEVTEDSSDLPF